MKTKILFSLVLATGLASVASRADETNSWRYDTSLNLFLAGLSGNVIAHGQPANVDVGFGDIAKNLEFAAAGRFTVGYERWSLSTELSACANITSYQKTLSIQYADESSRE